MEFENEAEFKNSTQSSSPPSVSSYYWNTQSRMSSNLMTIYGTTGSLCQKCVEWSHLRCHQVGWRR